MAGTTLGSEEKVINRKTKIPLVSWSLINKYRKIMKCQNLVSALEENKTEKENKGCCFQSHCHGGPHWEVRIYAKT